VKKQEKSNWRFFVNNLNKLKIEGFELEPSTNFCGTLNLGKNGTFPQRWWSMVIVNRETGQYKVVIDER
jgi:hypothetical protein